MFQYAQCGTDVDHLRQRLRAAPTRAKLKILLQYYSSNKDEASARELAQQYCYLLDAELLRLVPDSAALAEAVDDRTQHSDAAVLNSVLKQSPRRVAELINSGLVGFDVVERLEREGLEKHCLEYIRQDTLYGQFVLALLGRQVDEQQIAAFRRGFINCVGELQKEQISIQFAYQKHYLRASLSCCGALLRILPQDPQLQAARFDLQARLLQRSVLSIVQQIAPCTPYLKLSEALFAILYARDCPARFQILEKLQSAETQGDAVSRWIAAYCDLSDVFSHSFSTHCKILSARRAAQELINTGRTDDVFALLQAHSETLGPWGQRQQRLLKEVLGNQQ